MSWNSSDNNQNGSNKDPWAKPKSHDTRQDEGKKHDSEQHKPSQNDPSFGKQNNKHQGPPDIEEIFNNLLKKVGSGQNSNQNGNLGALKKIIPIFLIITIVVWAISGFYTIKEAERGVVLRFGKVHNIVQPGLNWKPSLIDKVIPVNIEKISEIRTQGRMLTQDENMVVVELAVQFRVNDPVKNLFNVTNPNDSLAQATDSALRYVIGHMKMDDILTTGRSVVRADTWSYLESIIKPYDIGIEIIDVNFQSARPPEEVKDAFDDAIKAQEDEQRFIRNAEAYAREIEPIARGNAQRIVEQATAYRDQVVLDAKGEVQRFQQLLPEYKAAPELLHERMYIQAMERVMSNTPKIMLDSGSGNNLTVLPLEQLLNTSKASTTSEKEQVVTPPKETNAQSLPDNLNKAVEFNYQGSLYDEQNKSTNGANRHGRFE